jgi:MFS transporter, DHA1 family, tetracycline resistance protein
MRRSRQAGLGFIFVTVLIDLIGFGIVIPVLPALVGTMTAGKTEQSYWYGLLLASYACAQFLSAPLLGALSDRFGRRPMLLVSIFGLSINFLLTSISPWLWLLLVARLIGGGLGASYTIAGAYIADITTPENRSKGFGLIGAAFGLGFIFGPALGGVLAGHSLRLPYMAAAGLGLLNWLYGFFVLPESLPADRRSPIPWKKANPFSALWTLMQIKNIGVLVLVFVFTVFAQFLLQSSWALYTTFRFGWDPKQIGFSLLLVGITGALTQAVLLRFILRWVGDLRATLIGMSSGTLAYLCYGLATQGWIVYVIIVVNALAFVVNPALQGMISKQVDPREQGITLGSLNSISSLMAVIGPLVGTPFLAWASRFEPTDWRVGGVFYLASAVQAVAWLQTFWYSRSRAGRRLLSGESAEVYEVVR